MLGEKYGIFLFAIRVCYGQRQFGFVGGSRPGGADWPSVDRFPDSEVLNGNAVHETYHEVDVQAVPLDLGRAEEVSFYLKSNFLDAFPVADADRSRAVFRRETDLFDDAEVWPSYCGENGVMCKIVESKLRKPSRKNRRKRYVGIGADEPCEKEVKIQAIGSNFTLCIFLKPVRDEPILAKSYDFLNVSVFINTNVSEDIPIDQFDLQFALGHVLEEPFGSVSGYVLEDSFYGTIYLRDVIHFLEPHSRKSRDLRIFGEGLTTLLHSLPLNNSDPASNDFLTNKVSGGFNDPPRRKLCDLTLVADHLYFREVGEGSVAKTVLQMLWHVKEANAIFVTEDFDDNGKSECIGLTVSEITIFQSEDNSVNLLTGEYKIPEDFLKRFSRYNFDGFCLGVLFTNRIFEDLVLGLSWRGNPKHNGVGGICQNRVRIKSDKNAYSFNALFISLRSSQEKRIPLRMGVLNLVHELMHSFGAKHDPDSTESPDCTPEDKWLNGRFLMSKYSNDGHKLNHMILSPCTKDLVRANLASVNRISCLMDEPTSFCGDGIASTGEECDCGTIFQCVASRSCCIPPEGGGRKRQCTVQKDVNDCVP